MKAIKTIKTLLSPRHIALLVLCLPAHAPVQAADTIGRDTGREVLRDPTLPPMWGSAQGGAGNADAAGVFRPRQILIVAGTRYLLVEGRKLKAGDRLGEERIQRITDTEIWLRGDGANDGGTRKIPLYDGVEKRNVIEKNSVQKNVVKQSAAKTSGTHPLLKEEK